MGILSRNKELEVTFSSGKGHHYHHTSNQLNPLRSESWGKKVISK
jgi:hypothetical protein